MIIAVGLGLGCNTDKATPEYTRCNELALKGSLEEARAACAAAASADPTSNDGLAAAAKRTELDTRIQQDRSQVEAMAAAKVAADTKAKVEADEARCKGRKWATKCMTGHRPDGTEKWTGMQTFDTRADCVKYVAGAGTCDECGCM